MSDSETVETKKRGRPSANDSKVRIFSFMLGFKTSPQTAYPQTTPKKRPRNSSPAAVKKDNSSAVSPSSHSGPAKRGRGRPKGTFKKGAADKLNSKKSSSSSSKGRGRPSKPKKDESTEDDDTEENDDDDDDDDDEDEENESESDA